MSRNISIFIDSCNLTEIGAYIEKPFVKGVTTNPTLMRKAGVVDYMHFARNLMQVVGTKEVAFEVVTEEPVQMLRQAMRLQELGPNVNVKVPMMNSQGASNLNTIAELMAMKVHVNITAMICLGHVSEVLAHLPTGPAILSVFAGRLADAGDPPIQTMREAAHKLKFHEGKRLLWASVREPVNIYEADDAGCHIITVPPIMLEKAIDWYHRNPDLIAQQTSQQFNDDAIAAGLTL